VAQPFGQGLDKGGLVVDEQYADGGGHGVVSPVVLPTMNMPMAENATRLDTFFSACRVLMIDNDSSVLPRHGSEGTTSCSPVCEKIFQSYSGECRQKWGVFTHLVVQRIHACPRTGPCGWNVAIGTFCITGVKSTTLNRKTEGKGGNARCQRLPRLDPGGKQCLNKACNFKI
jgi:hypothetical protein